MIEIENSRYGAVQLIKSGSSGVIQFFPPNPKTKHICKECGGSDVYFVGKFIEHCRSCDNWQVTF